MMIPTMYFKSIRDISYQKLKDRGIKCLIFDLDNTLVLLKDDECPGEVISFIKKLQQDFQVCIVTNSPKRRILPYQRVLDIFIVYKALKPIPRGLYKIKKKYHLKKEEMIMIGDQLLTDILSAKRFGIQTILVDPLSDVDLKITKFNRLIENRLIQRYQKKGKFQRGKYYE